MGEVSHISWTDHTCNFWQGCVKVSALCDNCYAERDSLHYGNDIFGADKRRIFPQSVWPNLIKWNKKAVLDGVTRRVFVMSFGDFFEDLKDGHPDKTKMETVREQAMILMESEDCSNLEFLVLTKRISNVPKMVPPKWLKHWPKNVRLGISVGTQKDFDRDVPRLIALNCPNFLSMEPLLELVDVEYPEGVFPDGPKMCCDGRECGCHGRPIDAPLIYHIDWLITGGESGPGARPAHPDWYRRLRNACTEWNVPFHYKQWGEWALHGDSAGRVAVLETGKGGSFKDGKFRPDVYEASCQHVALVGKKAAGRLLDGEEWLQFPRETK